MHVGLNHFLGLSGIIFAAGLYIMVAKKEHYSTLMGFQLIFTSLNLALIAVTKFSPAGFDGLVFSVLLIITGTLQITALAVGLNKSLAQNSKQEQNE